MLTKKSIITLLISFIYVSFANAQVCAITSDVNDICIGDEVNLTFSYPAPDNYSVSLNGIDQFVNIPHVAGLDFATTNFSVEFYFDANQVSNAAYMVSKISTGGVGYSIGLNAGLLVVTINDGINPPTVITGTTNLVTGQWYHVAVTFDRVGLCILYLDGFIDAQQTIMGIGSLGNTDPIGIGGPAVSIAGLTTFFDGNIDEVRIWSRILPSSEIISRMTTHINPDSQIGLAGYWDMNEGINALAVDCSTTQQDGTLMRLANFSLNSPTLAWSLGVVWNTGDVGNSIFDNPSDTTLYIATAGYCKYICSDSLEINVLPCDSGKESFSAASVWVPNAFTPNADLKNDVFLVQASFITYYEIMVYARNGNIVFHSKNIANSWDGSLLGDKLTDDTYVYVIIYRDTKGEEFKKYGHVTVLR